MTNHGHHRANRVYDAMQTRPAIDEQELSTRVRAYRATPGSGTFACELRDVIFYGMRQWQDPGGRRHASREASSTGRSRSNTIGYRSERHELLLPSPLPERLPFANMVFDEGEECERWLVAVDPGDFGGWIVFFRVTKGGVHRCTDWESALAEDDPATAITFHHLAVARQQTRITSNGSSLYFVLPHDIRSTFESRKHYQRAWPEFYVWWDEVGNVFYHPASMTLGEGAHGWSPDLLSNCEALHQLRQTDGCQKDIEEIV